MNYLAHLVVMISIYAVLTISLELLVGQAGLLSLSHAVFYGVGAYASAWVAKEYSTNLLVALPLSMSLAASASLPISLTSVRLRGDYFMIATLVLQMIASSLFISTDIFTGGAMGIANIPFATVLVLEIDTKIEFLFIVIVALALVYLSTILAVESPFGRVLRAIREDELLARSLGKNVTKAKIVVLALSSAIAGGAGCLYSFYVRFVDPTSFSLPESVSVLTAVLIGGAGNIRGSVLGAAGFVLMPEVLSYLGMPPAMAANLRQVLYGIILIAIVFSRQWVHRSSRARGVY